MLSRRHATIESEDTGIDLAPMLDFVLNLLIFFIITTSFVKESGINVTRPQALTAEHKESGNILIAIRPNGEIWMDKRRVVIADKASQTGVLTKVMDEVKLGGIGEVSIAAAPPVGS